MSLDFDNIDEGAPSYAELVASGRYEILKGASVESCWEQLVVTHDAFTEVARQAKLRGTCLADVTAALRVVALANETADTGKGTNSSSSYTVSSLEQPLVTKLANVYLELYRASPVPTVHQWLSLVQENIISDKFLIELSKREHTSRSSATSSLSVNTYQRKLLDVLQGELHEDLDVNADDDGTFAENELRLFVKRCLTLARRCKRAHAPGSQEEQRMQGAVDVLNRFICSNTLEW